MNPLERAQRLHNEANYMKAEIARDVWAECGSSRAAFAWLDEHLPDAAKEKRKLARLAKVIALVPDRDTWLEHGWPGVEKLANARKP